MSISFTNYVDITSGVAGASSVQPTELILNVFDPNPLVPTGGAPLTFDNAAAVLAYFGSGSAEYAMAQFYFGWVSKSFTSPESMSFSSGILTATAPLIFGAALTTFGTTLADLNAVTNGGFALTMGGFTNQVVGLDFSGAGTLGAVATIIQDAIQAFTGGGSLWTAATVTYAATPGAFNLVGGATGAAVISVAAPTSGVDISTMIGWIASAAGYSSAPIFSKGQGVQTVTELLTNASGISNNFGSFNMTLMSLDQAQIVEASTWNNAQNFLYMFLVPVTISNASAISAALTNLGGTALTLSPVTSPQQYPELVPGMILAATNYLSVNSTSNYMFQQFALTPSVSDDTTYSNLNNESVNFYGQTQTAGVPISFYQTGVLTGAGVATNATDQNVYANEQWFKNAAAVALMNLLIALTKISANPQGQTQVLSTLQSVINQALNNGTISVGNALTQTQIATITSLSNDPNAWFQVQNTGYWVDCVVQPYNVGPNTFYKIVYTLIYKKDDTIRLIDGAHALI